MTEAPGARRERLAWLLFALWSGVILATVPIARALQRAVKESLGGEAFLVVVSLAIAVGVAAATWRLRGAGRLSGVRVLWLLAVALAYAALTWSLRRNPVEALHFVEYGVLGALAYRALSERTRDPLVYVGAALAGGAVGIVDEAIQWLIPGRLWDLRDIGFNFLGASMVQIGIAAGVRPARICEPVQARSAARLCGIAIVVVLLLGASLLNTPRRIAWYAARVPGLGFLGEGSDVMLEYGHLYDVPGVGRFRSRLSPDALARTDAERGPEAGATLATASDGDYKAFLARYTPISDPFLHEARVHLFRRDRYLLTAENHPEDEDWYRSDLTVGYREDAILRTYFGSALAHSGRSLSPERLAWLSERQFADRDYESRVSEGLVTDVDERHVVGVGAVLLAALAATRSLALRSALRVEDAA